MTTPADLVALRTGAALNQTRFWGRLGVPRTTGSRYELGETALPESVAILLNLAYGPTPIHDLAALRGVEVPHLLKSQGFNIKRK